MTDTGSNSTPPTTFSFDGSPRSLSVISYGLVLGGFLIPFLPIAGVVLAYIKKGEAAGTAYASHFDNVIFTFWVALAVSLASFVLMFIGIGFLTMLAGAVWAIYRSVLGIIRALEGKAFAPMLSFEPGYVKRI